MRSRSACKASNIFDMSNSLIWCILYGLRYCISIPRNCNHCRSYDQETQLWGNHLQSGIWQYLKATLRSCSTFPEWMRHTSHCQSLEHSYLSDIGSSWTYTTLQKNKVSKIMTYIAEQAKFLQNTSFDYLKPINKIIFHFLIGDLDLLYNKKQNN